MVQVWQRFGKSLVQVWQGFGNILGSSLAGIYILNSKLVRIWEYTRVGGLRLTRIWEYQWLSNENKQSFKQPINEK